MHRFRKTIRKCKSRNKAFFLRFLSIAEVLLSIKLIKYIFHAVIWMLHILLIYAFKLNVLNKFLLFTTYSA